MTEMEYRQLFAKRIRQRINRLNIDQRELARRAGISEVTLSRYIKCRRKPTFDIVNKIAYALECEPGDLINIDEVLE
jgi:transcriptional regulator with XRE-family HTH domain